MDDLIFKYGAQLITGIIAICGILLGLFWTQFFNWIKYKREQKSKLNHLLFHLLELHHFVNRHNFTDFINFYLLKMEEKLGKLSDDDKKLVEQMILPIIKEKLNELNNGEETKRLSEHYEAAVKEVAFINPFLAFKLAGQSKQLNNFNVMNDYFEAARNLIPTEEGQKFLKNFETRFTEDKMIKEMIDDIRDSIIKVSKEVSVLKKREAKAYLIRQELFTKNEIEKEIQNIVNQIEKQISQQNLAANDNLIS